MGFKARVSGLRVSRLAGLWASRLGFRALGLKARVLRALGFKVGVYG